MRNTSKCKVDDGSMLTGCTHCLAIIRYNPARIECFLVECPSVEILHRKLEAVMESNRIDTLQFKQWTTTD